MVYQTNAAELWGVCDGPPGAIERPDAQSVTTSLSHNTRSARHFGQSVEHESLSGKLANAVD